MSDKSGNFLNNHSELSLKVDGGIEASLRIVALAHLYRALRRSLFEVELATKATPRCSFIISAAAVDCQET